MQPEISRRCLACGASFREGALFCPECGKPLARVADNSPVTRADEPPPPPASAPPESAVKVPAAPSSLSKGPAAEAPIVTQTLERNQEAATSAPPVREPAASAPHSIKHETARAKLQRASTATREALAENVKRVDKIRQVSTVMFEEASYDPSLRFVLVALGLFIVFIVLLVLSKVMG
jgi:uncharacterized Zn finger protein (UPF0148 family)